MDSFGDLILHHQNILWTHKEKSNCHDWQQVSLHFIAFDEYIYVLWWHKELKRDKTWWVLLDCKLITCRVRPAWYFLGRYLIPIIKNQGDRYLEPICICTKNENLGVKIKNNTNSKTKLLLHKVLWTPCGVQVFLLFCPLHLYQWRWAK